jgi:hypothetical protein
MSIHSLNVQLVLVGSAALLTAFARTALSERLRKRRKADRVIDQGFRHLRRERARFHVKDRL